MQTCEYCLEGFEAKRRFVQRFCSASCRVLFHRYGGDVRLRAIKKETIIPQENLLRKLLIQFYEDYLGKQFAPKTLRIHPFIKDLGKANLSEGIAEEVFLMENIQKLMAIFLKKQPDTEKRRIRLFPDVFERLEKYVKN